MNTSSTNTKWVWSETTPNARITSVYFRREFNLDNDVESAHINVFVHSRYHLRINGQRIGVGPVRSYPEYPEFDSYDLTPYLQIGANVIAIHAVHVADESYHQLPLRGAFIAWGLIKQDGDDIDLATPGDWIYQRSLARDEMAPRFSFAIGNIDNMDLRKEAGEWWQQKRPAGKWNQPTPLKDPLPWGTLKPRSIPALNREFEPATNILGIYEHEKDENILSFRLSPEQSNKDSYAFAYTYIHSPCEQVIKTGTWWGEYFINGEYIAQSPDPDNRALRMQATISLKCGWNLFCVGYGLVDNIWEFHLAYAKSAGLHFSVTKDISGKTSINACEPLLKPDLPAIDGSFHPDQPEAIETLGAKWKPITVHTSACSPIRSLAWPRFSPSLIKSAIPTSTLHAKSGKSTSFILDYSRIQLGQIIFTCNAPEGTCIDVGFAEELNNNRPAYDKNYQVMAGERRWCRAGKQEIEFFFPRGFRYVQITVSQHTADVSIESIGVLCQRYPYNFADDFKCSDKAWTQLWHEGIRTLDLCSEDVITDCPWRERTLYGGDLLVEAATSFATTGDTALIRHCIDIFVQSYTPETHWLQSMAPKVVKHNNGTLFDYPLLIIHLCGWYYRYSGDLDFVKYCIPVFRDMMHTLRTWKHDDGSWRIADGFAAFIDWIDIEKRGNMCSLNALIARVFKDYAGLLRAADMDEIDAEAFDKLGAETGAMLYSNYWDNNAEAFADIRNDDGSLSGDNYIASSSWPSVFGFCNAETNTAIASHIKTKMESFDPLNDHATSATYGAFYYLGALYQMGEEDLAEECVRTQYQLMIKNSTGTIWEHSHNQKSLVHAWSTAPTYYGSTRILGVRIGWPEQDNLDEILIAPQASSITWAHGTVMHPKGPVYVDWKVENNHLYLSYKAPAGLKITVMPKGTLATYPITITENI